LTISELNRAYQAMPPWHKLRRTPEAVVNLPLPATPALAAMDPQDVVRGIRGTGGNLESLAADYDQLAEEIFNLIAARERGPESTAAATTVGAEA
jgi:hypothetical protein